MLLEYRAQTLVLFSGTQRITVRQGPPPSTPAAIPVTYALPDAASISIAPRDSVLTFGDALDFRVTAFDAQQQPMAQFYVSWSVTAPQLPQPIDARGHLVAVAQRQVVLVKAVTPTGIKDSTTLTLVPRPTQLLKVGGDQQLAPASSRLPALLEVEVRAADNLPVAGVPVSFGVVSGGGSVDTPAAVTDGQGRAATGAVLGGTPGLQQFSATVAGVGTVTFDATATTVSPGALTWTGAASTDWSDPNNWNPARVPTSADDVTIPAGTPLSPQLTANCSARTLTVNSGAALALNGFNCQVGGNVFADGNIFGPGAIQIATAAQVRGPLPDLLLSGPVTAVGSVLAQSVTVTGTGGQLIGNGQNVDILGNLAVQSGARLVMTNPADRVQVFGNASFSGGDESTALTAGFLGVVGNFTQSDGSGTPNSFVASGTHVTALSSNFGQTVSFQNPGPNASRFQNLQVFGPVFSSPRTVTLASPVEVSGQLSVTGPRLVVTTSANPAPSAALTARGGMTLANAVFDNATVELLAPAGAVPLSLSNLVFTNMDPSVPQVAVTHTGAGGPFTLSNLTFNTVPSTGFYLAASDADGPSPAALTLDVTGSSPPSGAPYVRALNGAVVNWPALPPGVRTWAGSVSDDWNDPNNWNPAGVPLATDSVSIPSGTPFAPLLGTSTTVRDLTVAVGTTLTLQPGVILTVTSDLSASAVDLGGGVSGGTVVHTGGSAQGNMDSLRVTGNVVLSGDLAVLQDLTIAGSGNLDVNDHVVTVSLDFSTVGGGTLRMDAPGDFMTVGRHARFAGGSEAGKLTEGFLGVGGDFTQDTTGTGGATSFAASGNHLTSMFGNASTVRFATPGVNGSAFQHFDAACATDSVTFASAAHIRGNLDIASQCSTVLGGPVQVGGNALLLGRLAVNGQHLRVSGTLATSQQGTLVMQSPLDTVEVDGAAVWDGGFSVLSDGTLILRGDFAQGGTFPNNFTPSGNHVTRIEGPLAKNVSFVNAGPNPTQSHFHHLELVDGGGPITLNLANAFFVTGTLTATPGTAPVTIIGNGASLETTGNWNIKGLKLDRVLMRLDQSRQTTPALPTFDNVSFVNYTSSDEQLRVAGPGGVGGPRTLTFSGLQFTPLQANDPGFYVRLFASSGLLTLNILNSNQSPRTGGNGPLRSDPPNEQTVNGATILWP